MYHMDVKTSLCGNFWRLFLLYKERHLASAVLNNLIDKACKEDSDKSKNEDVFFQL